LGASALALLVASTSCHETTVFSHYAEVISLQTGQETQFEGKWAPIEIKIIGVDSIEKTCMLSVSNANTMQSISERRKEEEYVLANGWLGSHQLMVQSVQTNSLTFRINKARATKRRIMW